MGIDRVGRDADDVGPNALKFFITIAERCQLRGTNKGGWPTIAFSVAVAVAAVMNPPIFNL